MNMTAKKVLLAAGVISVLSLGSLAAMTAPAAAHVVCDWDGDDCYRVYPGYYDRDREWREHRAWEERHEWEERREREDAYRHWYWSHRPYYGWDAPAYSGANVWFNF